MAPLFDNTTPDLLKNLQDSLSKKPCEVCGEPTSTGADISVSNADYVRHPVCKVQDNPLCLETLMERFGGNMRSIYPSRGDL